VDTQTTSLPPITVLFREAWEAFTKSILNLLTLALIGLAAVVGYLIVAGVMVAIFFGLTAGLGSLGQINPSLASALPLPLVIVAGIFIIASMVFFVILGSVSTSAQIMIIAGYKEKVKTIDAIRRGFSFIIPLISTGIILFFFEMGGFFAFVIPVLLFAFFFMFTTYEVVLDNQKCLGAIKRSFHIVTSHFGEILVRIFVYLCLYIALFVFIPNIVQKIEPETGVIISGLVFIANFFLGWFGVAYMITLYKHAKAATSAQKPVFLRWIWIISIIGWTLAILITISIIAITALSLRNSTSNQKRYQPQLENQL
jgi:hypothetical protein